MRPEIGDDGGVAHSRKTVPDRIDDRLAVDPHGEGLSDFFRSEEGVLLVPADVPVLDIRDGDHLQLRIFTYLSGIFGWDYHHVVDIPGHQLLQKAVLIRDDLKENILDLRVAALVVGRIGRNEYALLTTPLGKRVGSAHHQAG